ncbi:MAG: hypothetical protein Q9172_003123 [Xanthocarpia lactea]
MGGKAFAHGPEPLLTPRMAPAVYRYLLNQFQVQLAAFFAQVATPIEAPEKDSFGDIDFLVAKPTNTPFEIAAVAKALNAQRTLSSRPLYSLAVPHPGSGGSFVQLDISVADNFEWDLFHKSHGDLWNIIGTSIRPFGLTANDKGLHLRIQEIEHDDRKKAMVFLTADPDTVLDFLGLDKKSYSQPFDTVEQMFSFACSCRFFRPEPYKARDLKSNDRKRMTSREVYKRFVEDFLPKRTFEVQGSGAASGLTREDVFEEALKEFDKRQDVEVRIREWQQKRDELGRRQGTRQWRKEVAMEENAYTDAWIKSLRLDACGPSQALG